MESESEQIILRRDGHPEQTVDHPEQPADYVHADGSRWTWVGRVRVVGGRPFAGGTTGGIHVRVYDLVVSDDRPGSPP